MTQLTAEQQLTEQVKDLKSRILDTQDALVQSRQSEQELATALTEIAKAINLSSETGEIQLIDVVEAVKALVPTVEDVDQEA